MTHGRKGPLAVALIGLLLFGGAAVSAQSTRTDTKKKPAAAKSETVAKQRARKQAPSAQEPVPLPQAAPGARFQQQLPLTPPGGRQSTATADAPSAPVVAPVGPPTPAARSAPSPDKLNMVRTAPEQIGQVPSQFMWIRDGLMAARDPVDGALVFLNDEGRVLGRAKLPAGFDIREILTEAGQIRLINAGRQIAIPRNIDPVATAALQDAPVVGNGEARLLRLTRRGPQHLTLQDDRRAGTRALDVRSIAGGHLAQAYEVGPGSGDNRYVVSEEIVGSKPSLQVRVFVQRFDRGGKLTGIAYVSFDGMDSVPRDFVAITGDGTVRVLVPMPDGVKMRDIAFAAPPHSKSLNADQLKSLGRVLRDIAVDSNVMGDSTPFRREAPALELAVPTPPIKRETALANARAYLTVNWVMLRENFAKPGVENSCEPAHAKFWMRPRRFSEDMIGTTLGPMPYRWGGDDTPGTYRLRTEWGALAGSICTCRDVTLNYCLFPDSAGVDCSGFVSRAWGIDKRGTSGLLDVADEVNSVGDLKPGDAFNWAGRHVRLFTGLAPGAATAFVVLESSTRLECEGVCERTLRPSEVDGYRMIRYRGMSENGIAAIGTTPAATTTDVAPAATSPNGTTQNETTSNGSKPTGTSQNGTAKKRATEARRR